MKYLIPIIVAISMLGYEIFNYFKKKIRINRGKKFNWDTKYVRKINNIISKNSLMNKLKKRYVIKLGVINNNTKRVNEAIVVRAFTVALINSLIVGFILLKIFTMWYIVMILTVLTLYIQIYIFDVFVNIKLKKIYTQFPDALQLFTDEYITTKNIKNALNKSYSNMPKAIRIVFERLTRELTSSKSYKKPIQEFAHSLAYVWGYAFAELLLISYEEAGDISDDLLFLIDLINEEVQADEEDKTEQAGNKMVFIVLSIVTGIVFVINMFINPIAKELYFYTSTGNVIILSWVLVVVGGISASVLIDKI